MLTEEKVRNKRIHSKVIKIRNKNLRTNEALPDG